MRRKFRLKFPDASVSNRAPIYNKMKRFGTADSTLGSKRKPTRLVLTGEKLCKISGRFETSPGISWSWNMQKMVTSALTTRNVK
jgi:hypothetical protein